MVVSLSSTIALLILWQVNLQGSHVGLLTTQATHGYSQVLRVNLAAQFEQCLRQVTGNACFSVQFAEARLVAVVVVFEKLLL